MIILEATVRRARRNREFGRVEALIDLIVKQPGHPARRVTIRTSQPAKGTLPLRQRLCHDAALLARHIETSPPVSACAA